MPVNPRMAEKHFLLPTRRRKEKEKSDMSMRIHRKHMYSYRVQRKLMSNLLTEKTTATGISD